jgi:hypothetical protein
VPTCSTHRKVDALQIVKRKDYCQAQSPASAQLHRYLFSLYIVWVAQSAVWVVPEPNSQLLIYILSASIQDDKFLASKLLLLLLLLLERSSLKKNESDGCTFKVKTISGALNKRY